VIRAFRQLILLFRLRQSPYNRRS